MLWLYLVLFLAPLSGAFLPRYRWARNSYPVKAFREGPFPEQGNEHELHALALEVDPDTTDLDLVGTVTIFPAREPLSSYTLDKDDFSVISWNVLLPNSDDNWWNHKMYSSWVPMEKRQWSHRKALIQERLLNLESDIICIQEAAGDTFDEDFAFLKDAGYEHCLHKKFRFRCATFFKQDKFTLVQEAHKDRTLVTQIRSAKDEEKLLNIVNCHLSGGAAPDRRLRQVHEAVHQIQKWKNKAAQTLEKQRNANRPSPKNIEKAERELERQENAGVLVCGDFNSDGNTGVRRFLVHGSVDKDWREPQYPNIQLTSNVKENFLTTFQDAAELAYGANVCDGDYGEEPATGGRPATYVVPNLASLLLLPVQGEGAPRTEFGYQMARGIADTLGMKKFNEEEIDKAFDSLDLDGNNLIDEKEVQLLLETVYANTYGRNRFLDILLEDKFSGGKSGGLLTREQLKEKLLKMLQKDEQQVGSKEPMRFTEADLDNVFDSMELKNGTNMIDQSEARRILESVYANIYGKEKIEKERRKFFDGFRALSTADDDAAGLSREQLKEKLVALQQQLEGGNEGNELVEIKTEQDAQAMIDRFTPVLLSALDEVFNKLSGDGESLSEDELAEFLVKTNGQLGRGGMWRHTQAMLDEKAEASKPAALSREDWYGAFARELGEGKWWQVVYDLETYGANLRSANNAKKGRPTNTHYQGWLDYLYFDSHNLQCKGIQDALTASEVSRIYEEGDALPNEWHPSDHLPVAAVFSWQSKPQ